MTEQTLTDTERIKKVGTTLLNGTLIVLGLCTCTIIYGTLTRGEHYGGINLGLFLCVVGIMASIRILYYKNWVTLASICFVSVFALGCAYGAFTWGASMPITLLGFGLTIVFTTSLLGNKNGIVALIVTAIVLITAGTFEMNRGIPQWKSEGIVIADLIIYTVMLGLTTLVGWLAQKQIAQALNKASSAEMVLRQERQNLTHAVAQKVQKIEEGFKKEIHETQHQADFGKIAQGLFHDMINPINTLTLTIEGVRSGRINAHDAYLHSESLRRAISRTQRYLAAVKNNLGKPSLAGDFDLKEEVLSALALHEFRARRNDVELVVHGEPFTLYGDPIQLGQVISTFVSNSLDAFEGIERENKKIIIHWKIRPRNITLSVKDNAIGMSSETLSKIFNSFFTTKENGNGFGLSAAKETIEKFFKGSVSINSELGKGTTVTCNIPLDAAKQPNDKLQVQSEDTNESTS